MKDKTYIAAVLDLLRIDDFNGVSETIDIAKGKYEFPSDWVGIKNNIKRNYGSKKNSSC